MGTFTEGVMMDIPDVGLHCFEDTLPPDRNTSLVISLSSAVFCRIQVHENCVLHSFLLVRARDVLSIYKCCVC